VSDAPRRGDSFHPSHLLLSLCGAFWLCGCGVQGTPRPPRVEQPQRVTDLAVAQSSRTLTLGFTAPQLAADGERLTKPQEMEILRAILPAGQPAPASSKALQPWATVSAEEFAKLAKGGKVIYPITLTEDEFRQQRGETLLIAARTLTRGWRGRAVESGLSNLVRMTLLDVPRSVEDLRVVTTEHALELSWKPPARALSGEPAFGISAYRVYRRTGQPGSFLKIGETDGTAFPDTDFEFGRTYTYKVAAVMKVGTETAEGDESPVVEITPRDTFPPTPPTGLSVVFTSQAVELVWTASPEADLAGYNVYRREGSGPPRKVNQEIVRTPVFRDASVVEGRQYFYRVTALDLANNESAPSEEVSVEAR
jgi:hypothetical protein